MFQSVRRFALRIATFFRSSSAEAELSREIESHLQLLEDKFRADGMNAEEARYAARRTFGGVEQAKEHHRASRTFSWLTNWKLDLILGVRMLVKYPGLSLVAVVGMAVAIAIAAGYFSVLGMFLDSRLPFEEADRIVALRHHGIRGPEAGDMSDASMQDFLHWREELKSVAELSAYHDGGRNLLVEGRHAELVPVAAVTASGFQVTRVAPILGRPLLEQDERLAAPPVVVIGYDEWQRVFQGDAQVIGRTIRLDETVHTVVGVMPRGFGFPIRHFFWVPLRLEDPALASSTGRFLRVFGRLAPGSSMADARAELAAVGERMAAVFPQTNGNVRPEVLLFTRAHFGIQGAAELTVRVVQMGIGLLLLIVAVNVAILVYARTATRLGEIAVRTALGASRARIVAQFFLEGLVLSGASAAIGLGIAAVMLREIRDFLATSKEDTLPFWVDFGLTNGAIFYAAALAGVAALIVGGIPALKATTRRVHPRLQQFASRTSGVQLGRTWTALIIVQVAIAVAALPPAIYTAQEALHGATAPPPAPLHGLLRGTLTMSQGAPKALALPVAQLVERLRVEPEVAEVTLSKSFPGYEQYTAIEVETDAQNTLSMNAYTNRVAANTFEVFDVPLLAGRAFSTADEREGSTTAIIDQTFAEKIGGGNVVGRRVRYVFESDGQTKHSEWFEIVGVAPAFSRTFKPQFGLDAPLPRIFHASAPGGVYPSTISVRVNGTAPERFAPRLIDIAATVDPRLRVENVESVVEAWKHEQMATRMIAFSIISIVGAVLLLSAAGIYAMMSFTVASRRREIGIRAALGADARGILVGVFRRAAAQLGAGVMVGASLAILMHWAIPGGLLGDRAPVLLPMMIAMMLTVGLLSALGPARRGLAVEPAEALRYE